MRRRHRTDLQTELLHAAAVDLHGLTAREAVAEMTARINALRARSGLPVAVIHGYGSGGEGGVIKKAVRGFLRRHSDCVEMIPGEEISGNPGVTLVLPLKPLPTREDELELAILEFCRVPKTRIKIINKFRRFGQPEILARLKRLKTAGALAEERSGKVRAYRAVPDSGD